MNWIQLVILLGNIFFAIVAIKDFATDPFRKTLENFLSDWYVLPFIAFLIIYGCRGYDTIIPYPSFSGSIEFDFSFEGWK